MCCLCDQTAVCLLQPTAIVFIHPGQLEPSHISKSRQMDVFLHLQHGDKIVGISQGDEMKLVNTVLHYRYCTLQVFSGVQPLG